ncbi:hypothetical protein [Halovivax sp.]|uniref:DUF7344 domain-containing protein n=1 Tax=Halovivax sp. TaxID=1935978 RepID=UPI0025B9FFBC|nr:hypothetical protein [Halovivax sp.]
MGEDETSGADGSPPAVEPLGRSADGGEPALTPGTAFDLLAQDRRRYVLYVLSARGGSVHLDELATRLAARKAETGAVEPSDQAKRRERTALYHAEVPKLVDYGVVDYDPTTCGVTLTGRGRALEPYLEFARTREPDDVGEFLDRGPRPP